jgi:hypothetical protein
MHVDLFHRLSLERFKRLWLMQRRDRYAGEHDERGHHCLLGQPEASMSIFISAIYCNATLCLPLLTRFARRPLSPGPLMNGTMVPRSRCSKRDARRFPD